MRDLEMRGAGELLGTRQHGYIASVGFHLYTRLLAQAVRQIRQLSGLPAPETTADTIKELALAVGVDLPIPTGIPADYVPEKNVRLSLYRRIADLHDEAELDALVNEFEDRFGSLPEQVVNLFYQMRVKLKAEAAGLSSITIEGDQLVLRFPPLPEGMPARNLPSIGLQTRAGKNAYWIPFDDGSQEWRPRLLESLSAIIAVWQTS
jgi:transcription-repair coupling factor (superfamily II helicase)